MDFDLFAEHVHGTGNHFEITGPGIEPLGEVRGQHPHYLILDGQNVGTINSPCYSHRMGKSLGLAHVEPGLSIGTTLKVLGDGLNTTARITASPVYDPGKLRTHG